MAVELKLKVTERPISSTTLNADTIKLTTVTLSSRNGSSVETGVSVPSSSGRIPLSATSSAILTLDVSTTASSIDTTKGDSHEVASSINNISTSSESSLTHENNGFKFDATIIHTGLVTEKQYKKLKSITRYLMLVLPEIGVVLNAFNAVIFSSKEIKNPFSRNLVCLSLVELLAGVFKTVVVFMEAAFGSRALYSKIYLNTVKYVSIYGTTVVGRSIFCYILFIAAERLIAVGFPLKATHFKLIKKPVATCIGLLVFIALYHIQMSFKFDVTSYKTRDNEVRYKFALSSYYLNYTSLFSGLLTAGDIAFVYVPLLVCLILNVILTVTLRNHSIHRQQLNSSQDARETNRADTQITVTVLVSSVLFIILVLPLQLTELVQELVADYGMYRKQHFLFLVVLEIESIFYQLAFYTNFICYYTLGGKFRKVFNSKVFRCHSLKEVKMVTRVSTDSTQF